MTNRVKIKWRRKIHFVTEPVALWCCGEQRSLPHSPITCIDLYGGTRAGVQVFAVLPIGCRYQLNFDGLWILGKPVFVGPGMASDGRAVGIHVTAVWRATLVLVGDGCSCIEYNLKVCVYLTELRLIMVGGTSTLTVIFIFFNCRLYKVDIINSNCKSGQNMTTLRRWDVETRVEPDLWFVCF